MSKKKKKEESALQGAKMPVIEGYNGAGATEEKSWWVSLITWPLSVLGCVLLVFGLVKLIKFSWFF